MLDLQKDEELVIEEYRKARDSQYADVLISVDKGTLVKIWVTSKRSGESLRGVTRLKENKNEIKAV